MSDWVKTEQGWQQTGGNGVSQEEVDRVKADLNNKQNKTDNSLNTSAKTIVGAINELNSDVDGINESSFERLITSVSIPSTISSYTVLANVPFPSAGTYLVRYGGVNSSTITSFASNSMIRIILSTSAGANRYNATSMAIHSSNNYIYGVLLVTVTEATKGNWNIYGMQNSGANLDFAPFYEWIKLK